MADDVVVLTIGGRESIVRGLDAAEFAADAWPGRAGKPYLGSVGGTLFDTAAADADTELLKEARAGEATEFSLDSDCDVVAVTGAAAFVIEVALDVAGVGAFDGAGEACCTSNNEQHVSGRSEFSAAQ